MLAKLRKLLAECHINKSDTLLKVLDGANIDYLLSRIREEIISVNLNPLSTESYKQDAERRLKLCVQLITLARLKLKCVPLPLNPQSIVDQKQ